MDYDKMYFPKTEMSQLVPTGHFSPETYAAYAESFDLSLLPTDGEVPLSPQSELSTCLHHHNHQQQQQSSFVSLEYLPTTIYNDQQQQPLLMTIKTEKPWSNEEIQAELSSGISTTATNVTSTTDSSILLQQLQKQYQFYPSPLPSPPQYDYNFTTTTNNNNNNNICASPLLTHLPPSPCPSIDQNFGNLPIKQEHIILPPSPPESNGAPSPFNDIKIEPDIDTENLIDINTLLEKSLIDFEGNSTIGSELTVSILKSSSSSSSSDCKKSILGGGQQDHQLLREYLQDTTFQKKHNLKPLALESLFGGLGVRGDIEPVISLALEHAKRDAQATCAHLQISPDPQLWTTTQVHSWIRSTIEQFKLSPIDNLELKFPENGANLLYLSEEEFVQRVPESGGTIHAQLEIWKLACCENFLSDMIAMAPSSSSNWVTDCGQTNMDITDDEEDDLCAPTTITASVGGTNPPSSSANASSANIPVTIALSSSSSTATNTNTTSAASTTTPNTPTATTATQPPKPPRAGGSHIHLWQFLKELLATPQLHGTAIRWLDRTKGVFKIEDSVRVAKLWGRRKNRPAMNYDKLSRSIRQYYKKGIMKKTERSQRLVYQFCHPYCL